MQRANAQFSVERDHGDEGQRPEGPGQGGAGEVADDGMIGRTFVELADTLVEGYDVIEFLHLLAGRCVTLLGVSETGVVLADSKGVLRPLASSSERMRELELIELQCRGGPCLDCYSSGSPVIQHDLSAADGRWPDFAGAALRAGFRSVYALPLRLRSESIGALNLFSERLGGLCEEDQRLGQALADVATIGLLHQRLIHERGALAEQLQVALDSRVSLEQAKGVVAEQAGTDMSGAFQLLRGHARHHNRPLGEVVAAVIRRELSAADLRVRSRSDRAGARAR